MDPASQNAYAVGSEWQTTANKSGLVVIRKNGTWTSKQIPGTSSLNGVSGSSEQMVFAVGSSSKPPNALGEGVVVDLTNDRTDLIPQVSELNGIAIFHGTVVAVGQAGTDNDPKGVVVSGGPGHWQVEEVANVSSLKSVWVDSKGTIHAVGYSQPPGTNGSEAVGVVATKTGKDWLVDRVQGAWYLAAIAGNDEGDLYVAGETLLPDHGKKGVLDTRTSSGWTVETQKENSQFRGIVAEHSEPNLVGLGWNGQEDSPEVGIVACESQGTWRIRWISGTYILLGITRSTPGHSIAVGHSQTGVRDFQRSNGVVVDELGTILWKGDLYRRLGEDVESGAIRVSTEYHVFGVFLWICALVCLFFLGRDPN